MSDNAHADVETDRDGDQDAPASEAPDHESDEANLGERDAGAAEEKVQQEANFRPPEDETAPGA